MPSTPSATQSTALTSQTWSSASAPTCPRFLLVPEIIFSETSDPTALRPANEASATIPPVPQNGSSTVPPSGTRVRLTSARAYFGWSVTGHLNGSSVFLLRSYDERSTEPTLLPTWTLSETTSLMSDLGARRSTPLDRPSMPPVRLESDWRSTSL